MLTKKLFSGLFPHADESLRFHDHQTPGLWIYNLLRKQHRFQLSLRKRKNAFGKLRGCQRNGRVRRTPAMTKKRHVHAVFCHIFFSSKDFSFQQAIVRGWLLSFLAGFPRFCMHWLLHSVDKSTHAWTACNFNAYDVLASGLHPVGLCQLKASYNDSISARDNPVFAAIVSSATPAFLKFSAMSSAALRSPDFSPLVKPDFSPLVKPDFSPSFTPAS